MANSPRDLAPLLRRIAETLERLAPPAAVSDGLDSADAFVWHAESATLSAVPKVSRVEYGLLQGISRQADILLENTRRFAQGLRPTMPCCGARAAWARAR